MQDVEFKHAYRRILIMNDYAKFAIKILLMMHVLLYCTYDAGIIDSQLNNHPHQL